MDPSNQYSFLKDILIDISKDLIYACLLLLFSKLKNVAMNLKHYWNTLRLILIVVAYPAANVLVYICMNKNYIWFLIGSSLVSLYFYWNEINSFWAGGLIGFDGTVSKGLGYHSSLKLCKNQLEFMGIGAAKLTNDPAFEKAIRDCNRNGTPIRFLLTKPQDLKLRNAAEQKGLQPQEYRKKVEKSLEKLAEFKKINHINIEVRFYPKDQNPIFRLMFINNSICLASYYVLGEGDGSQLPQLQLKRFTGEINRDVNSFYHPFHEYFEDVWKKSERWNFKFPIGK